MCIVIHLACFQKCHLVNNLFKVLPNVLAYMENISNMKLSTLFYHVCSNIMYVYKYIRWIEVNGPLVITFVNNTLISVTIVLSNMQNQQIALCVQLTPPIMVRLR